MTFAFEMKSGREHSTPDKAMWGFACTVRPQEIADDSTPLGLPFLLDIHLSIASVNCLLIGQLFNGAPPTEDELSCKTLMKSSLLQRYMYCTLHCTFAVHVQLTLIFIQMRLVEFS